MAANNPGQGVTGTTNAPGSSGSGGVSGQTGPGTSSPGNFGSGAVIVGPATPGPGANTSLSGVTGTASAGAVAVGVGVYGTFPGVPGADWQATEQGAGMSDGYLYLRRTFTHDMPSLRQQLDHLAHRPIGG